VRRNRFATARVAGAIPWTEGLLDGDEAEVAGGDGAALHDTKAATTDVAANVRAR
jgi:hypothetical protein